MSQYPPSPYTTPNAYPANYGFDPMGAYLAPGRRASLMMFIMGGLGFACGICMGLVGAFAPVATLLQQGGMDLAQFGDVGMPPEQFLKIMYIVGGGMALLASLILIVLGFFVRRGSMVATIIAIIICGLGSLFLLVNTFTGLFEIVRQHSPQAALGLLFVLIALGAFVVLLTWLVQAARGASALHTARAQYQMQYWQYMQQQQMYMQQAGHGYAQAPPPRNPTSGGSDAPPTQG
jgi:hypothetical protein